LQKHISKLIQRSRAKDVFTMELRAFQRDAVSL